jgi:hypothetical protein
MNGRLTRGILAAVVLAATTTQAQKTETAKLTPTPAAANDLFGFSVSSSGNTVLVGAYGNLGFTGAAHVFERDQGGPDAWGQTTKITADDAQAGAGFGWSVSVDGDVAVVGARWDDHAGSESGSAYVFYRDQGGADSWGQVAKLVASDAAAEDYFGYSVAVSGDIAVVGAWGDDDHGDNSGSAYIFARDHGGSDHWGQLAKLTGSAVACMFGLNVAVDGDTAIISAYGEGKAYVFYRDQGGPDNWGLVTELTPVYTSYPPEGFGASVAVDSDLAVVSAHLDDEGGTDAGAVYLFARDQGGPDSWGQVTKMMAEDPAPGDYFGYSVSVGGDAVVAGTLQDDDGGEDSGSAYLFLRDTGGGDSWGQAAKMVASDAAALDWFGCQVAVDDGVAVVGAWGNDDAGGYSGSAYVFAGSGGLVFADDFESGNLAAWSAWVPFFCAELANGHRVFAEWFVEDLMVSYSVPAPKLGSPESLQPSGQHCAASHQKAPGASPRTTTFVVERELLAAGSIIHQANLSTRIVPRPSLERRGSARETRMPWRRTSLPGRRAADQARILPP